MTTLTALQSQHQAATAALERKKGQQARLLIDLSGAAANLSTQKALATLYEQTAILLQQTATEARTAAKTRIEGLVTQSLQAVFGPDYAFCIELTERGGRPEAEFRVVTPVEGGALTLDPQDSKGGGVVDVVSLSLRVAMLETYRPRLGGPLVLDEPAKMVSADFVGPVAELLATVVDRFDRQCLMVTHNDHLAATADRTFRVELQGGTSQVMVQ